MDNIKGYAPVVVAIVALLGFFGINEYTDLVKNFGKLFEKTSEIEETTNAYILVWPRQSLGVGSTIRHDKTGAIQVYVPAGEFLMGSEDENGDESPIHAVYLDTFWIDQTEIDQGQFALFVDETGHSFNGNLSEPLHPVVSISWHDAKAFCEWRGARLPTEAEWEKAARWNEATQESFTYPWGNQWDASKLNAFGSDDGFEQTAPVGSFPDGVSPYGALDMAGNALEWVNDWYSDEYYISTYARQPNPQGPMSGEYRVVRGYSHRSAARHILPNPFILYPEVGSRCAQTVVQ